MMMNNKAHRDACKWAYDILARQDWALIDTETSGLRGVILELAIIGQDGRELFNSLVHPDGESIEEGARTIHKLSDADLARAPKLPEIWPQVQTALAGRSTLVAYNAAFDSARIAQTARRYELPKLDQEWQCAMERYSQFCGEWNSYHGNYKWQRLPGAGHRAIEDARAALDVIKMMAATWERKYQAEATKAKDDERAGQFMAWLSEQEAQT